MAGASRYLIVNADDFGLSLGINRGILAAHAHGIVTSASLMVRWPAAAEAAAAAGDCPRLSLGLHVDLGEWAYRGGEWQSLYEVVPLHDRDVVAAEVEGQLDAFRRLVGSDPTHLDSHQHIHRKDPARSVLVSLSQRLGIALRHYTADILYCGDFYAQDDVGNSYPQNVSFAGLNGILTKLKPGWTELACHPGQPDRDEINTMYVDERHLEVATLCDPEIRETLALHGIELRSFADICRPIRGQVE